MNKPIALLLLALSVAGSALAQEVATVIQSKVNVRGQPTLRSEVVTQLQKGESVTILERVPALKPKPGEPAFWARIKLPANTPVWAFSSFLKNGEVSIPRLNLRAGPGENYSILGTVPRGIKIKEIRTLESWSEIEPPDSAFAYIDASLLKTESAAVATKPAPSPAAAAPTPPPAAAPATGQTAGVGAVLEPARPASRPVVVTPVPESPAASPATVPATVTPQPAASDPTAPSTVSSSTRPNFIPAPLPPGSGAAPAAVARRESPPTAATATITSPSLPAVAPAPAPFESTVPKRIVRREGIVRLTKSVQAPSWYELVSPETGKVIDYLRADNLGVDLKHAKGQRVIVSGEEGIDPRWPNTPVLELESIETAP